MNQPIIRLVSALDRLMQLYLYDMTDSMPFPVGSDGRFEYGFLDRFWRFPYLIYAGEEIAGFALVIDECPLTGRKPCWFMAEFFVLKAHRRKGTGHAALRAALALHPGDCTLRCHVRTPRPGPSGTRLSPAGSPRGATSASTAMTGSLTNSRPNKKARIAAGLPVRARQPYSAASGRLTTVTPFCSFSTSPSSLLTI